MVTSFVPDLFSFIGEFQITPGFSKMEGLEKLTKWKGSLEEGNYINDSIVK